MVNQIFVNLPVADLEKSKAFFQKIGYTINPQFTDDTAACVVMGENIFVMILTHEKFRQFTPKVISDAGHSTEVLTALSLSSREDVNEKFRKAIEAGGTEARPEQDYGFMLGKAFNDLDGHIWELIYMDMSQFPQKA